MRTSVNQKNEEFQKFNDHPVVILLHNSFLFDNKTNPFHQINLKTIKTIADIILGRNLPKSFLQSEILQD